MDMNDYKKGYSMKLSHLTMDELADLKSNLEYNINVLDCFGAGDVLLLDRVTKLINALNEEANNE